MARTGPSPENAVIAPLASCTVHAFAALAVSHWIEHRTGWSIEKFVQTTRVYRTVGIRAGHQTAATLPTDLAEFAPRSTHTAAVHTNLAEAGIENTDAW